MKFLLVLFLGFTLSLTSCTDQEKDDQLKKREEILLMKEQEFSAKEQDYASLKSLRDSLEHSPDTIINTTIPANILGKYNGKMICTDSNCSEHVVGDLRNDIWEVTADGVKIMNKSGGEKLYNAKHSGSDIILISENNSTSTTQSVITLQLPTENTTRIKGSREFTNNGCNSKFSVDLEKIKN